MRSEAKANNTEQAVTHESVTSESVRVEHVENPLHVAKPKKNKGSTLIWGGYSFSLRCLQLFERGHSTVEIAEIMNAERNPPPGKYNKITEARVYNALAKVRTELFEKGIKLPLGLVRK